MTSLPKFPHLNLSIDEEQFITRMWQSAQSSGHILSRAQIESIIAIVDASFAPKPPAVQSA